MNDKKIYPAIYANGLGCNILWFDENKGISLDDGGRVCKESTSKVENITNEYLQNTYGEVQSPEHAEFIIELAKNEGFEFTTGTNKDYPCWFTFDDEIYFFKSKVYASSDSRKQITIPLPPKSERDKSTVCGEPKSDFVKAIDRVNELERDSNNSEKPNSCEEWPQVGDKVAYQGVACEVKLTADNSGHIVVVKDGNYCNPHIDDVIKPKSPQDLLIEELQTKLCKNNAVDNYILACDIINGDIKGLVYNGSAE